jgi:DNA ligase 1
MIFDIVSNIFEEIESIGSRLEMTECLAELFKMATPKECKIISYLSLGEMHPPYEGSQFQFAEKSMIKVVARLLKRSDDEVKELLNEYGDLGLVVLKGSWKSQELSVEDVFKKLQEIELTIGIGSQEKKSDLVYELLHSLNSISAKFVVRILLGKLRLGFSDMTIVDALSWMLVGDKSVRKIIEHAYNVCADIGKIAYVAKKDGIAGLKDMKINIGIPIRPAAAERLPTASDIIKKLGSDAIAQPKLDGFRLQIHVDKSGAKPKIEFFSRNLIDMSYMFPDLVEPFENLDVQTLICEGEAIVYDPNTGHFVPFQETVKRKRKHGITELKDELPLKVFIFDILYLNGKSLLSDTHKERRIILEKIFANYPQDIISIIDEVPVSTAKELEDYFYKNIDSGLEGVVVKKPDSIYQPGKRNFNWVKLKRQEEGQLEDTIDCVVLGYYFGQGKRTKFGIGGFLVGIFNKNQDRFESISKVGTGLTDNQWIEFKKKCDMIKVINKPKNVECAKELYPDVWVSPEIVVLIRADEITKSPRSSAGKTESQLGYALRFPRFMGYRPDKSPTDSTSVSELIHMFKDQRRA